jgi:tetratricopeptide (TPR) repeat protein
VLAPEQIRDRLMDRFRLLTAAGEPHDRRHHAMGTVIEWSYEHAEPSEQRLLRALAVCVGGWSLEAAAAIAAVEEFATLDLLAGLVRRSLVIVEPSGAGAVRYRMLETVREFLVERLAESGEAEAFRRRHLEFVRERMAEAETQIAGPRQSSGLAHADREHENALAALAWALDASPDPLDALRLVRKLTRYWTIRGQSRLARRMLASALARAGPGAPAEDRVIALFSLGDFALWAGDQAEARQRLGEALAIYRQLGDARGMARTLNSLGVMATRYGPETEAVALLEESLALYESIDNERGVAIVLGNLGVAEMSRGDLDTAQRHFERTLALGRTRGERDHVAATLINLTTVSMRRHEWADAIAQLHECLQIVDDLDASHLAPYGLEAAAEIAMHRDDPARCARLAGVAAVMRDTFGLARTPSEERDHAAVLARARDRLGAERFGVALEAGRTTTVRAAAREAIEWLSAQGRDRPASGRTR